MKKRLLPALLALVMVLSLMPMGAFAAEAAVKEIGQTDVDGGLWLDSGSYRLTSDLAVDYVFYNEGAETISIDLNGYNITQNANSEYALIFADVNMTITNSGNGGGEIKSAGANTTIQMDGRDNVLTVGPGVTITCEGKTAENGDTDGFALFLSKDATNATATLNGCTISGMNGITVNGNNTGNPVITLNGATITAKGHGIYQAGPSTFNVNDCTITSENVGIENRAGTLNVSGGTVTGGSGAPAVSSNSSGTTASNAGIVVAQHVTDKSITVSVANGATVSGGTAMLVADPEGKQSGSTEGQKDADISVVVSGAALETTQTTGNAVSCTESTIGVALVNTQVKGEIAMVEAGNDGVLSDKTDESGNKVETPVATVGCTDADGKEIEDSSSDTSAIAINGQGFITEASKLFENSGTVVLLKDVTATSKVTVSNTATLDLNGHKLTAATAYTIQVNQNGNLTIIDSSSGEPGEINNTHATASTIDVNNGGKLTLGGEGVNNFIIENSENKTTKQNSAIKVEELGTLVINGGTVRGPQAPEGNLRSIQTFGTTTINGGTFEGEVQVWTWKENSTTYTSTTTINGGEFKDTVAICNPATESDNYPFTGTLEINGGTFTNENDDADGYNLGIQIPRENAEPAEGTKVEIFGGTFPIQVDPDYLAHGLNYEVKAGGESKSPYSYYETVQEAVEAAAENGGTVTKLGKDDETEDTPVYVITFNVNGGTAGTFGPAYVEGETIKGWPTSNPTRTGYTFNGWFTAAGKLMTASSEFTANTTLYAQWTSNGGSGSGSIGGSSGSGSTSRPTSNVTISSGSHGSVTSSPSNPKAGDTVTLTVRPNSTYMLDTLTVRDSSGNVVELTKVNDTTYTFTMPTGKVTVTSTFVKDPDAPTTNVTVPTNPFVDVPDGEFYTDAVLWAVENGITTGTSSTTFSPNAYCTRGQIVTFLWRAAGSPVVGGSNPFTDVTAGSFYYDAVLWAVANGITNGTSSTTFSPDATCNRAQAVTFLWRANGSPVVGSGSGFGDVADGTYYADAVQWAVANSVTNGTSSTTFSPDADCTRGQIVTFLYRANA